ncbi:unnamed protein product [Paramecium sonneborni]|uniref:Transmembrane protein n=1 Tax=Paramecium sonneborni TaxID=65129 RepID=A0A8S1RAG5_9CILI|nr:unnamed protein product [Paramecium sonneborni]
MESPYFYIHPFLCIISIQYTEKQKQSFFWLRLLYYHYLYLISNYIYFIFFPYFFLFLLISAIILLQSICDSYQKISKSTSYNTIALCFTPIMKTQVQS